MPKHCKWKKNGMAATTSLIHLHVVVAATSFRLTETLYAGLVFLSICNSFDRCG